MATSDRQNKKGKGGGGGGIKPKTSFFCHSLKFGFLVFLKMAYSDSLQQCQTSNTGKIHEKIFLGSKFGPKTTISYKIFETNSSFHLI